MTAVGELKFKCGFVVRGDRALFSGAKGRVTDQGIQFKWGKIAYGDIATTESRSNRLVLVLADGATLPKKIAKRVKDGMLVLEVDSPKADKLEAAIDRNVSKLEAEKNRERLQAEGRAHEFRTTICPHCSATIDLSELPNTDYTYCRYCHTVFRENRLAQDGRLKEASYQTCDECGFFDRIRSYTEFYFYFLLVIYGFSYKERHMCDSCAGRLFWKTFVLNFVFVLGVPAALWLKIKSMLGRDPELAELAKANRLARRGNIQVFQPLYDHLLRIRPGHPGIYTNAAKGFLVARDANSASTQLESALSNCANYLPAIQLANQLQDDSQHSR